MRNQLASRPVFTSTLPQQPVRRSRGRGGWIAAALALIGVIAYLAYDAHRTTGGAVESASGSAHVFLAALSRHNYKGASAMLSEAAKLDNTPDTLRKQMSLLEQRHGALIGADLVLSEPRNFAGLATCRLTYTLRFTSGSSTLSLILAQDYPRWRINSLAFGPAAAPMISPLASSPPLGGNNL